MASRPEHAAALPQVPHLAIRTQWTLHSGVGAALPVRAIELLVLVHQHGSLQAAAKALGVSYRHAWDVVQQCETYFHAPLLVMVRGKGSRLTALGEKLVWAERRIAAGLKPVLDSLASEITAELGRALHCEQRPLRLHASHGFAIERLAEHLAAQGVALALHYGTSTAAAAALHEGACDVAGLHLPVGPMEEVTRAHYQPWLGQEALCIIDIAQRRQGLMVRPGNPREIFGLADLAQPGVQFINRQTGSGTRLLLDALLQHQGIDPQCIPGFEQSQNTHAAVAAHVAAGMADVGFGLELPARACQLDFVPVVQEHYFLLCRPATLQLPAVQAILHALHERTFLAGEAQLPGYDFTHAGRVRDWPKAP